MTSNLTYNQLIEIFKNFKERHYQLNDFYEGMIDQIGDSKEFKYPLLAVIPTNSRLEKSNQDRYSQSIFRFNILVGDLVNSATKEQDIRSDTLQILQDMVAEFDHSDFYYENNIIIESTSELIPFSERFDDLISGWVLDISIKVPFKYNPCFTPADEKPLSEIIGKCN